MKVLQAISLIMISLAAGSAAYYLGYALPNERRVERAEREKQLEATQLADNARRCMEDGTSFFRQFKSDRPDPKYMWDDPEFHFSKKLNTCLAHTRFVIQMWNGISLQYNELFDVYGHNPMFYGHMSRDTTVDPWKEEPLNTSDDRPNYKSDRYFVEKEKLFAE